MSDTKAPQPASPPANQVTAAVDKAEADARKAADAAQAARDNAARVKVEEARALSDKADKIDADAPGWEEVFRASDDVTERLVVPGGYIMRSSWVMPASLGKPPLSGSAIAFVAGAAPSLHEKKPVVVRFQDLPQGMDPETVTMDDLPPSPRLAAASEVLLRMPDGSVRLLKGATDGKK